MSYKINIHDFEGPLDLLLFFIQRDKLNIYDIPISKITKDFFDYISMLNQLNIEVGGDFIYIASLLMRIKSRMLLPREKNELEEEVDPRTDLVSKLIEYKKFKEISQKLSERQAEYSFKHKTAINEELEVSEDNAPTIRFNLYDIIRTYSDLIDKLPDTTPYRVKNDNFSINDQIDLIKNKLINKKKISFKNIIKSMKEKISLIYTFIAVLEMIKNKEIKVEQKKSFSEIYIVNNNL